MTTDAEIYAGLTAPFPEEATSWRVGATNIDKSSGKPRWGDGPLGVPLAYIDARDVMDRLDAVVGFDSWQDAYVETQRGRVLCALSLFINGEWITKSDGAGETDIEGDKGGISDAFKRAAVKFGIGRYLYRLKLGWVPIKKQGKSYVLASRPDLPDWATTQASAPTTDDEPDEEPFREVEEPPKPKKRFSPRDEINAKLEQMSEKTDEDSVRAWLTLFLKHEPLAGGELSVGGIRANIDDWRELYENFKIEANRAFDMGFNERKKK